MSITQTMQLLKARGLHLPPDRLHMLPAALYDTHGEERDRHVEEFKWGVHKKLVKLHGAVAGRFGDKLWDVARLESLQTYLRHVRDPYCYVFWDPKLGAQTLCGKLPGQR